MINGFYEDIDDLLLHLYNDEANDLMAKNIKELKFIFTIKETKTFEPRSDRRDILAIKVNSEIFTEKERLTCSYCEQLQRI